mgnify:CR=1 FL=1
MITHFKAGEVVLKKGIEIKNKVLGIISTDIKS